MDQFSVIAVGLARIGADETARLRHDRASAPRSPTLGEGWIADAIRFWEKFIKTSSVQ
jgi:hypothetical protein